MPKAVVLADRLSYYEEDDYGERVRVTVDKGAEVELSQADFDRHLRDGAVRAPGSGGWPRSHAGLDELAAAQEGFAFSASDLTVAQKREELEAAGVEPAPDES